MKKLKKKREHKRLGGRSPDGSSPVDLTRSTTESAGSETRIREVLDRVIGNRYSDTNSESDGHTTGKKRAKERVPRSTLNTSRRIASMEELRRTTLVNDLQLETELTLNREESVQIVHVLLAHR